MWRNNKIKQIPRTAIEKINRKKGKQNRNKIGTQTFGKIQNRRTRPRAY